MMPRVCKGYRLANEARVDVSNKAVEAAAVAAAELKAFNDAHHALLHLAARKTMPSTKGTCRWLQAVLEHDQSVNQFAKLRGLLTHLDPLPYLKFHAKVYETLVPFARTTQDVYDLFLHAHAHRSATPHVADACVRRLIHMMKDKTMQGQAAIMRTFAFQIVRTAPSINSATVVRVLTHLARLHLHQQLQAAWHTLSSSPTRPTPKDTLAIITQMATPPASLSEKAQFALEG